MQSEIGGKAVDVAGDARCDSPGHSAQFGMYSLMDVATNKILTLHVLKVRIHFNGNLGPSTCIKMDQR